MKIRKVKTLIGHLKVEAEAMKLLPEDLVIIDNCHILEKIEGDPVTYLLNRANKKALSDNEIEINIKGKSELIKCAGPKSRNFIWNYIKLLTKQMAKENHDN